MSKHAVVSAEEALSDVFEGARRRVRSTDAPRPAKNRFAEASSNSSLVYVDVDNGCLILRELAAGVSVDYVQERTEPRLELRARKNITSGFWGLPVKWS